MNVGFDSGALTGFPYDLIRSPAGLGNHLFDAGGMNAAIENQAGERQYALFRAAPGRNRKNDRFGRIVNDEINARRASSARMLRPSRPMMRPFISSLGSGTTETDRFSHLIRGTALNGKRDDFSRPSSPPHGPALRYERTR